MPTVKARKPKKQVIDTSLLDEDDDLSKELDDLENWVDTALQTESVPKKKSAIKIKTGAKAQKVQVATKPKKPVVDEEDDAPPPRAAEKSGKKKGKKGKKTKVKREKKAKVYSFEEVGKMRSAVLAASLLNARVEYGDKNIMAAGEAANMLLGVPMPLAMQYVLQNSVWPLGRVIQLVGQEKSNKSTLTYEVMRWFMASQGIGYYIENETKYADDLAQSVFGYTDEVGKVMAVVPAKSLQGWQSRLTFTVRDVKKLMLTGQKENKDKGIPAIKATGRTFPVLFTLDSLAGGSSEEKHQKIEKKGYAERDYAIEALLNGEFLKKFRGDLVDWPFALMVVNHLKKQKAENGQHIERKKPGGKHLGFQESLELEMTKIKKLKYIDERPGAVSLDIRGNRVKIDCQKSGMGEENREIEVDFLWWYDTEKGVDGVRQRSKWQWGAALVDLILSHEGSRLKKIKDIVDVQEVKDKQVYSKRLGVPKDAPISKESLGTMIAADDMLVRQLQDVFAIKRRTIFYPGQDYKTVMQLQAKKRELQINED